MKASIRQLSPIDFRRHAAIGTEGKGRNVVPFPMARVALAPSEIPAGEDGSRQPGKGPVTVFVAAATIVASLGFVGHLAGLL